MEKRARDSPKTHESRNLSKYPTCIVISNSSRTMSVDEKKSFDPEEMKRRSRLCTYFASSMSKRYVLKAGGAFCSSWPVCLFFCALSSSPRRSASRCSGVSELTSSASSRFFRRSRQMPIINERLVGSGGSASSFLPFPQSLSRRRFASSSFLCHSSAAFFPSLPSVLSLRACRNHVRHCRLPVKLH